MRRPPGAKTMKSARVSFETTVTVLRTARSIVRENPADRFCSHEVPRCRRGAATRALTGAARDGINQPRCNNGKEVIPCLTSRWRVAQVRRTRLRSRPPGSPDAAGTNNPSKPASPPGRVLVRRCPSRDGGAFLSARRRPVSPCGCGIAARQARPLNGATGARHPDHDLRPGGVVHAPVPVGRLVAVGFLADHRGRLRRAPDHLRADLAGGRGFLSALRPGCTALMRP
jgi:hypothetical protein